jgi:hypothetical protein
MITIVLEYEFMVIYKPGRDALYRMPNTRRPTRGANQIVDVTLFHV